MHRDIRQQVLSRQAEIKQTSSIKLDYTEYNEACLSRKNLPKYVLERIDECITEIRERYPNVETIKLCGSYTDGSYIDEFTSNDFIELKRSLKNTVKISDFDFETTPLIFEIFKTINGYTVHLLKPRNNQS